jgi:DNA ligase D-like protein (predicted 3'-phosphoesterase)
MGGRRRRLARYRSRRDFRKTPEPAGGQRKGGPRLRKRNPIFVIQEHDASTHHFDLRLECDGVLASWAVPKGPSTDPRRRRLAVRTEDHPLEYADFEGVIPPDEYGGGAVIVWDAGPLRSLRHDDDGNELSVAESLRKGRIEVWLEGAKLRGGYALIHSKLRGEKKNWLLVKMKDEGADARRRPTRTEPRSVLSGRTLREVAEQECGGD